MNNIRKFVVWFWGKVRRPSPPVVVINQNLFFINGPPRHYERSFGPDGDARDNATIIQPNDKVSLIFNIHIIIISLAKLTDELVDKNND